MKKNKFNLFLFLVSSYCFVWLCIGAYHSYPNAEDLTEASFSRDSGVFTRLIESLQIVDGRYTTNLLHGINPLVFDYYYGYKAMPIIAFIFLFLGVFFLFKEIFPEQKDNGIHAFSMAIFFLGSIDLSSSFFWMICSFVYIYPIIFTLFFFNFFLRYLKNKNNWYFFLSILFIFLTVGTCELSIPFVGVILFCLLVYYWKDNEIRKTLILHGVIYLFSCVLLVSSPGVMMRFGHYENNRFSSFGELLLVSLKYSVVTFSSFGYIPLALYIFLFSNVYFKNPFQKNIAAPLFLGLILIFIFWVTVLWSKGDQGFSNRIASYPIAVSIILLLLLAQKVFVRLKMTKSIQIFFSIALVIFTLSSSSFSTIAIDCFSNKLTVFKNEMDLQYMVLNKKKCDSTAISKYEIHDIRHFLPKSVTDSPIKYIQENRTDIGGNRGYEKFFKVDEINLDTDTIQVLKKINEIIYN